MVTLNTVAWKASITVIQAVSIAFTIIRLAHRCSTRRMWWDDWLTFIPLLGDIVYAVIMWLAVGSSKAPRSLNIFFSPWFDTLLFYTIVWVSRISLGLSIARIFPPKHSCRRFAFGLSAVFLIIYLANVLMTTFDCYKASSQWYNMSFSNCFHKKGAIAGIYATVILDLLADLSLVASPVTMLWKVKLPKQQRRLILALFSSSLLPLTSSVIYCIIWGLSSEIGTETFMILQIMSQLQAGISLLVCNLLVVVMLFYRIVRREHLSDPAVAPQSPVPPLGAQPPLNTEEYKTASTNTNSSGHWTRGLESGTPVPVTNQSSLPLTITASPSIVLTSLYDDSVQLFSTFRSESSTTGREPSWHTSSPSLFEEYNITTSLPAWSFSEKSITNSFRDLY